MNIISFVIPVFNESANLNILLAAIQSELARADVQGEIIFVDDGSRDDSWPVLAALAQANPQIKALRLSRNFGKDAALAAGIERVTGDAVIIMDADLQHPPAVIPDMIRLWREHGAQIVETVKVKRGRESVSYKCCAGLFYKLFRRLSGFAITGQSDFCLLDKLVVEAWRQLGERNLFFKGTVAWLGFQRDLVEYNVPLRGAGQSGWTLWKLFRSAVVGIVSFSSMPLHLVTIIGVFFLCIALALGLRAVYLKFHYGLVDGITTLILLQLFIGSVIMISFGIVGEYIARIFDEVKARPRFVIRETVNDEPARRT